MDLHLDGRLIAITGAGGGIGRAIAMELATAGARMVLASNEAGELEEVAERVRVLGSRRVDTVVGDMTTAKGLADLREAAARQGGLAGLIACVGSTPIGTFDEINDDVWRMSFDTKFMASVRAMRVAAELMRRCEGGRIVIVAGNAARDAPTGMVTSTAINAALSGLVASTGRLLAPEGIGVVGLHPGPTRTARYESLLAYQAAAAGTDTVAAAAALTANIPVGKPAEAADIAAAAAFLVSPRAAHIVATCLTVDGGQTWG